MTGRICHTTLWGGLIKADVGEPRMWRFRWRDCWEKPNDFGHDSAVVFERDSIRNLGMAINVRKLNVNNE